MRRPSINEADLAKLFAETGVDLSTLGPISTSEELAPVLKTTPSALAQDRYRGVGIPYVKHGRRVRYLRSDVARYLANNRHGGTDD